MDTLNTYSRLSGAATLARALAPQQLALKWTTWNPSDVMPASEVLAGWTLGLSPGQGGVELALLYVYGRNFTWYAQNQSLPLVPVSGASVTLKGPPLAGATTAIAVCYNTTTGAPLGAGEAAGCGASIVGGDVVVSFPVFVRDTAAVVNFAA